MKVSSVGCDLLLDQLSQLKHRQEQPSPNEVIGHPVSPLLIDHIDHSGDHHHISSIPDKGFKTGYTAHFSQFFRPGEAQLLFFTNMDSLFCKQAERNRKQKNIHRQIGIADAVNTQIG